MIGRTISHYKILDKLGEGGMGVVYKAQDTTLDRTVALKFLTSSIADNNEARKRFINEAKAASSLEHPNICTIHEIGQTSEGHTFIVMPFYDGAPLSARVDGESIEDIVDWVRQTATGLAKAHQEGIIHRDIKSQNILVTRDGHVKIVDFGLAKLAGQTQLTKTGATLGTLQYMSPEQACGETVDHRTDIYSLGVVLYELLTGKLPFAAEHDAAVLYSVINTNPEPPSTLKSDVPPEIDAIVMRALSKERDDRYQSMAKMIEDLDRVSDGVTVRYTRKQSPSMVTRMVMTVAVVITISLVAWWFANRVSWSPGSQSEGTIGVMYFENLSDDPTLDWMKNGVVELLNTALSRSPEITVLDRQRMVSIVRELGGNPVDGVDQSMATDVARKAEVSTMVVGNIVKSGTTIRLNAKLIDVESGGILHSSYIDGVTDDDIFGMVASLTERIQAYLHITSAQANVDEDWMREISTSSVDAYRDYIRGRELFLQSAHDQARVYFERAIAADSNFVMAYVELVGACFNLEDYACIGSAYQQALRLRSKASRFEQLHIDVTGAVINNQPDLQISLSKELLKHDPSARFWRYLLGRGYYMSDQNEQAIEVWTPLIEEGWDWVWVYVYSSDACSQLGRYDDGLVILNRGFEITPPERTNARSRLHRYRGRVYRDAGEVDLSLADFQAAVELDPLYEVITKYDLGILYEQQGDRETAIRYFTEYLAEDSTESYVEDASARMKRLQTGN